MLAPVHASPPSALIPAVISGLVVVAACGGGDAPAEDPLAPDACAGATDAAFCVDFDQPAQDQTPFGFTEFLGGDMTSNVVTGDHGNHALSVATEGGAFGQSAPFTLGAATSASLEANLQPFETAPGKALVLGLVLLDGSSSLGRQVWVVAHDDATLTVDALGIAVPTTGVLDPAGVTTIRLDATWTAGGSELLLDVSAAPAGAPLVPILTGHHIALAPPPQLSASIAVISLEPGLRRFEFDNVRLDLQ
jgi:hypothetical protein